MTDDDLLAMSVPPERPSGESSVVVPFPGKKEWHYYSCWCDVCVATLVKRWKELHPDGAPLAARAPKPFAPFGCVCPHPCGR